MKIFTLVCFDFMKGVLLKLLTLKSNESYYFNRNLDTKLN